MILSLETSAEYCSVCLSEGDKILATKLAVEQFSHAASITLFIEECLESVGEKLKNIDAIAVSMGPGSYTGLRVGLSAAKGMAYALGKPLIGVNTLQALAYGAAEKCNFKKAVYLPVIDARRMEVYTASFDEKQNELLPANALILDEDSFLAYKDEQAVVVCGNAVEKTSLILTLENVEYVHLQSKAEFLVKLALEALKKKDFLDLAYCEPNYLKRPNITTSKKNVLG